MALTPLSGPNTSYKPEGEPTTPYQRAEAEWDARIGSARIQAKNWRLFALMSMAMTVIMTVALVYNASKSTVTPYVVQTNSDGIVTAAGPAKAINYTPQAPQIRHFLSEIVEKTRTLPLDPVVAKNNWITAYCFLHQQAINEMNTWANQEKPLSKMGEQTRTVNITSIIPQSKDTWQLRWKEDVISKEGQTIETYKMAALFTIDFDPPTDEKQLLVNPIGLYVRHFSWAKEVTTD